MKLATMAEKMPFYDMVIRLTHLWTHVPQLTNIEIAVVSVVKVSMNF